MYIKILMSVDNTQKLIMWNALVTKHLIIKYKIRFYCRSYNQSNFVIPYLCKDTIGNNYNSF